MINSTMMVLGSTLEQKQFRIFDFTVEVVKNFSVLVVIWTMNSAW